MAGVVLVEPQPQLLDIEQRAGIVWLMHPVHPLAALVRTVAVAPSLLRVHPSLSAFLAGYLRRFPAVDVGGNLLLHSHLPPLDSPTYARFVRLHLVDRISGPSHAQVAVTARCPQRCAVCYDRDRIRVFHFPPGTSKWNKIEHCLFCYITQNWRGKPLGRFYAPR